MQHKRGAIGGITEESRERNKMKKLLFAVAILGLTQTTPSYAEVIDVSTIKCSDLATMKTDEASYLLMWLHGYFGGKAGDTTIDLSAMEAAGKAIGDKCAENPDLGLMTAITQLTQ
jgi:acid stress chaperone HdeB